MREANGQWSSLANFLAAAVAVDYSAEKQAEVLKVSWSYTAMASKLQRVPPAKRDELKLQSSGAGLLNCSRIAFFMGRD